MHVEADADRSSRKLVQADVVELLLADALDDPGVLALVDDHVLLQAVARGARDLSHFEVAMSAINRALAIAPHRFRVACLNTLASTQRRADDPRGALDTLGESIEIDGSLESNRNAFTCQVAALRNLERLDEARDLGERLLERHPDDPKLLRTVAAVYADLRNNGEDAGRADRYFNLARAIDQAEAGHIGIDRQRRIVPALKELLRAARSVSEHGGTFCAFDRVRESFLPRLDALAKEQAVDSRLKTHAAYESAKQILYHALPGCRHCAKLYVAAE